MTAVATWRNRITGSGVESPDQILANPANWRVHPKHQQDALEGVLNEVGWVQDVIVNQRTGHLVDGHLRVSLALRRGEAEVPVKYVDLTEAEESLVLATLDPLSALATTDAGKLDELLRDISTGEAAVQEMLAELAERSGIVPTDDASWSDAFDALPDGDKSPFEQMTFTVHTRQAEIIRDAITRAKAQGPFEDTGNENGNGNALARICEAYVG